MTDERKRGIIEGLDMALEMMSSTEAATNKLPEARSSPTIRAINDVIDIIRINVKDLRTTIYETF